jgi:hypothetical protein
MRSTFGDTPAARQVEAVQIPHVGSASKTGERGLLQSSPAGMRAHLAIVANRADPSILGHRCHELCDRRQPVHMVVRVDTGHLQPKVNQPVELRLELTFHGGHV